MLPPSIVPPLEYSRSRERGGVDVGSSLKSRVMRGSTDETEARLVLKLDRRRRDGPFEKAEFAGAEGRVERPTSKGLMD